MTKSSRFVLIRLTAYVLRYNLAMWLTSRCLHGMQKHFLPLFFLPCVVMHQCHSLALSICLSIYSVSQYRHSLFRECSNAEWNKKKNFLLLYFSFVLPKRHSHDCIFRKCTKILNAMERHRFFSP